VFVEQQHHILILFSIPLGNGKPPAPHFLCIAYVRGKKEITSSPFPFLLSSN